MNDLRKKTYYAHGKLLLTGEYLVLKGALALAMPVRYGQKMTVRPTERPEIRWVSRDEKGDIWWQNTFELPVKEDTSNAVSHKLSRLLKYATEHAPQPVTGMEIETRLEFPRNWGLGSSSTLTHLIAKAFGISPFELHRAVWTGSGYDVMAAGMEQAFLYQLDEGVPVVTPVSFYPDFHEHIFFVFLNKKQNSAREVANFSGFMPDTKLLKRIGDISREMTWATDLSYFQSLMEEHEQILSGVLQRPDVQRELFAGYSGTIKSLGGWGGDFVMAAGDKDTPEFFKGKGYHTVIPFRKMTGYEGS